VTSNPFVRSSKSRGVPSDTRTWDRISQKACHTPGDWSQVFSIPPYRTIGSFPMSLKPCSRNLARA
jgi:hypothetical protein